MKKWFVILLTALMLFTLTACEGGEGNEQNTNNDAVVKQQQEEELSPWLKTKTGQFYSQFVDGKMYMKYETEYDGVVMQIVSATKGDSTYSETFIDGKSAGTSLMLGQDVYAIDHEGKIIVKMSMETSGQEMMDVIINEEDIDPVNVMNGTYEIDGKTYETEEWIMEDGKTILCFDSDALAYMVGIYGEEEMILKVLEVSNKVDERLFELPSDYEVMEM